MVKILLINPPLTQAEIYSDFGVAAATLAPLGLCYVAAMLERRGDEVRLIDGVAEQLSNEQLMQMIIEFDPKIVGFTAMTVSFNRAVESAKEVRKRHPEKIIFIGGPHTSSIPQKVFTDYDCFDVGFVGEADYSVVKVVALLEKKKFQNYKKLLKKIKSLVFRDENDVVMQTPRCELIKNLDELPHPARHLLPNVKLYNTILASGQKPNFASIVPSRGCPFQCIYCDQNVFGRVWRSFSAEYVIEEVEELVHKYGVKTLQIQDDLFTLKRERVLRFCQLLKEKNLQVTWNLSSRVNLIDEELARIMKEAGCEIVYFGIESGDAEVLKGIKKAITIEQVQKGVKIAKDAGLSPHGSFIIGLPFDTKETIEKTINFACSLPLDVVSFHIATPYPNTEFEIIAKDYGVVHISDFSQYRGHPDEVVFTPHGIDQQYLLKKQKEAYRRFYFRLPVIWDKVKKVDSWEKLKMYTETAWAILKPR